MARSPPGSLAGDRRLIRVGGLSPRPGFTPFPSEPAGQTTMHVLTVHALERNALVRLISDKGLGISVLLGLVFWNLSGQTVAIGAMVMLWAFWRFLPIDEGPPGLPFSCSFHLTQIVIGVFYFGDRKSTRLNSSHGYIS